MRVLPNPIHPHEKHYTEVHFYTPDGKLFEVMKNGIDPDDLLKALLAMTDSHNLVHIEARGDIVEICATVNKE